MVNDRLTELNSVAVTMIRNLIGDYVSENSVSYVVPEISDGNPNLLNSVYVANVVYTDETKYVIADLRNVEGCGVSINDGYNNTIHLHINISNSIPENVPYSSRTVNMTMGNEDKVFRVMVLCDDDINVVFHSTRFSISRNLESESSGVNAHESISISSSVAIYESAVSKDYSELSSQSASDLDTLTTYVVEESVENSALMLNGGSIDVEIKGNYYKCGYYSTVYAIYPVCLGKLSNGSSYCSAYLRKNMTHNRTMTFYKRYQNDTGMYLYAFPGQLVVSVGITGDSKLPLKILTGRPKKNPYNGISGENSISCVFTTDVNGNNLMSMAMYRIVDTVMGSRCSYGLELVCDFSQYIESNGTWSSARNYVVPLLSTESDEQDEASIGNQST